MLLLIVIPEDTDNYIVLQDCIQWSIAFRKFHEGLDAGQIDLFSCEDDFPRLVWPSRGRFLNYTVMYVYLRSSIQCVFLASCVNQLSSCGKKWNPWLYLSVLHLLLTCNTPVKYSSWDYSPGNSLAFAHILILGVGGIWNFSTACGVGICQSLGQPQGIWYPFGFGFMIEVTINLVQLLSGCSHFLITVHIYMTYK